MAGTLPRAIRSLPPEIKGEIKLDVRLVLPLHSVIHSESLRPLNPISIQRGSSEVQVEAYETLLDGMPVYFIGGEPIRASGTVYSSNNVLDGEKYTFFSLAALELPRQIGWQPNIIHANDWHTALAAYGNLVKRWADGVRRAASVTTLHNLPFMGPDVSEMHDTYRLPLAQTDLPGWARVLPLPLGMWASDSIVAVSPTYAQEVLTPDFGSGLQDFLKTRRNTLTGILNGLDTASFNPSDDPALTERFSR